VADRVFYNYKKDEIPGFIEKLNRVSEVKGSEFYSDYVKYRMIMLNLVAFGTYPGKVEDSVLINERFVPENQAFLDLVEQVFTGYFRVISSGPLKESFNRAIASSSLRDLKAIILKDGKATENQLQEYIILLNLYTEYYNGSIPLGNIKNIISDLSSDGSSHFIQETASVLLEKLLSALPGSVPPDFSLLNSVGRHVSLTDFRGKYLIMSFTRSDNPTAIMEFGILNRWYKEFMNDLEIVTILTDRDYKSAVDKMESNSFKWMFLDGSSSDILEYQYDIKMYPTFLILDRESRIIKDPAPFPSENLGPLIRKILLEEKNRSDTKNR
jgi:peroxiredoxin